MHTTRLILAGAAAVLLGACTPAKPFTCADNQGCVSETGAQGICEASQVCSFPDSACSGSRRRAVGATAGAAGACVPVAGCVSQVTLGAAHVCVLRNDGAVYCWGDNTSGQLGDGTATNRETPVLVAALPHTAQEHATQVSAGEDQTCALLNTGRVLCWGGNGARQLGDGTLVPSSPLPVQTLAVTADGGTEPFQATALSLGGKHACAIGAGGPTRRAWCWGENQSGNHGGQCGVAPALADDVPIATPVNGVDGVVDIGSGDEFTCARKDDKSVWCWGANGQGELGNGKTVDSFTPVNVEGLTSVGSMAVGDESACVLRADSSLWCWGYGGSGALGNGGLADSLVPIRVGTADRVALGGTAFTACILDVNGAMSCFGDNSKGQTATGATETNLTTPTPARLVTVATVATGANNGCALTSDGALWCWGENDSGQLGQGPGSAGTAHPLPVRVAVPCQ